MSELQRPIIVLGAGRSGTTALAEVLRHHPDVAVWEEPKHIWRFGHAYRPHDVLTAADATPRVKRYIRDQFTEFLRASGRTRFAELRRRGVGVSTAAKAAGSAHGPWRLSNSPALAIALPNAFFQALGLVSLGPERAA